MDEAKSLADELGVRDDLHELIFGARGRLFSAARREFPIVECGEGYLTFHPPGKPLSDTESWDMILTLDQLESAAEFDRSIPLTANVTDIDVANETAQDSRFRRTYNSYILSTVKDVCQLAHFRAQIIHDVQMIAGRRAISENLVPITWYALLQATHRYFDNKARDNYWSSEQLHRQELRWLNLLQLAFHYRDTHRTLLHFVLKQWRDDFVESHRRDQGPLPTCGPCTSKCLYRFEASEAASEPKLKVDFNYAVNRKDTPGSDSAAWFCRLLNERLIGQGDVDFSYCLAVHFMNDQQLNTDAQALFLHKARKDLQNFEGKPEGGGKGTAERA